MIDFLARLLRRQPTSRSTAKERLRLVLMTDHLALAPEMIDRMKSDLVDVISRYVEVDRERIEVNFEEHDRSLAMLANIPILSVNRPDAPPPGPRNPAPESTVAAPASLATTEVVTSSGVEVSAATPPSRKRRRRKKPSASPVIAQPATAN